MPVGHSLAIVPVSQFHLNRLTLNMCTYLVLLPEFCGRNRIIMKQREAIGYFDFSLSQVIQVDGKGNPYPHNNLPQSRRTATVLLNLQSLGFISIKTTSKCITYAFEVHLFTPRYNKFCFPSQINFVSTSSTTYHPSHISTSTNMDPNLNKLLNWGIANSNPDNAPSADPSTTRGLSQEALASLFGGPSDADLMKASMEAITSSDPEIGLDDKLIAFDNFEQLIENLDNANNLAPLALWTPLLGCLKHDEAEIRKMAAWCVGTAVQNNEKSQERCLALGGVELLTHLAVDEKQGKDVRRKACYALSSEIRNYQAAADVFVKELAGKGREVGEVDASDMDKIDEIINAMRDEASKSS